MIQVQHDRHVRLGRGDLDHARGQGHAGVLDGLPAHLDDDRGALFLRRLGDGLYHFHTVGIERADGKAGPARNLEQFLTAD
jgi:hypothetical protein